MKKRQHRQKQFFSIIASLLMVFSLLTPGVANAKSLDTYFRYNQTSDSEKISNRLADEFTKDDKVSFLIKFKEKADTKKVVQQVKANAKKMKLSLHNEQFLQRSAVVSELKSTAKTEQETVLKFLEQEKSNGNVQSIKPFFIVNGISVTATKEVAEKLATFSRSRETTSKRKTPINKNNHT